MPRKREWGISRICITDHRGKNKSFRRLWVRGKYVRDPGIVFTEDDRHRIDWNVRVIKMRIAENNT